MQRAEQTGPWRDVGGTDAPLTDTDAPWLDLTSPTEPVRYRVVSLGPPGSRCARRPAVHVEAASDVLVDLLESWRTASSHTPLSVEPVQGRVQVAPAPGHPGTIGWHGVGLSSIGLELSRPLSVEGPPATGVPRVEYLTDGSWQRARTRPRRDRDVVTLVAGLPAGTTGVRLRWSPTPAPVAVTGVTITSATASPATQPPGPFQIIRPAAGTGTPVTADHLDNRRPGRLLLAGRVDPRRPCPRRSSPGPA